MEILIILYIVGFARTLFIIAIIYFGIRLITRYILPMLVDKGVKNMQQKMNEQQRQNHRSSRQEGEVTIEKNIKNNNTRNKNKGDFIDFEEID